MAISCCARNWSLGLLAAALFLASCNGGDGDEKLTGKSSEKTREDSGAAPERLLNDLEIRLGELTDAIVSRGEIESSAEVVKVVLGQLLEEQDVFDLGWHKIDWQTFHISDLSMSSNQVAAFSSLDHPNLVSLVICVPELTNARFNIELAGYRKRAKGYIEVLAPMEGGASVRCIARFIEEPSESGYGEYSWIASCYSTHMILSLSNYQPHRAVSSASLEDIVERLCARLQVLDPIVERIFKERHLL